MGKQAIVTLKNSHPFSHDWKPVRPETATLSRRDVHTILVEWMGWEPVDVTSFWLICAKIAKRNHACVSCFPRHFLVKAKRRIFRVESAFSAADAVAVVCEAERCRKSDIDWVKPVPLPPSQGHPRRQCDGRAAVPPPLPPTQRKTRP